MVPSPRSRRCRSGRDLDDVATTLHLLAERGTGADRQRAAFALSAPASAFVAAPTRMTLGDRLAILDADRVVALDTPRRLVAANMR